MRSRHEEVMASLMGEIALAEDQDFIFARENNIRNKERRFEELRGIISAIDNGIANMYK
ncbi:hypothetical protein HanPI659440_Chr14g0571771 [Helianthus annuus]|nr:hypothetical protein HanPI659440_Chr14g0571771 [Helianthus annuus]